VVRSRRFVALVVGLTLVVTACGSADGPTATGDRLDATAFAGTADAVDGGGVVDLGEFADQDLVVWFWSPW